VTEGFNGGKAGQSVIFLLAAASIYYKMLEKQLKDMYIYYKTENIPEKI